MLRSIDLRSPTRGGGRRRTAALPCGLALLLAAGGGCTETGDGLAGDIVQDPKTGDCRFIPTPLRFSGDDPSIRVVFASDPATGVSRIDQEPADAFAEVQLVVGDRRLPFKTAMGLNLTDAVAQSVWPARPGDFPVHLTGRTRAGHYPTAAYPFIDPLAVAAAMQSRCGTRFLLSEATLGCLGPVVDARDTAAVPLAACRERTTALTADLAVCRSRQARWEALRAAITRLAQRLAPPGTPRPAGVTPTEDLSAIEAGLIRPPAPAFDARELARIEERRRDAGERLSVLRGAHDGLTQRLAEVRRAAAAATRHPPVATAGKVHDLLLAALVPGPCDRLTLEVGSGGLDLTGNAADAQTLEAIRTRFNDLAGLFPAARFAVRIEPGGGCRRPLGGDWSVLTAADGQPRRVVLSPELRTLPGLPSAQQCTVLAGFAQRDASLGRYFAPGQTPQVWCRDGPTTGLCKRAPDQEVWTFRPDPEGHHTGFAVVAVPQAGDGNP